MNSKKGRWIKKTSLEVKGAFLEILEPSSRAHRASQLFAVCSKMLLRELRETHEHIYHTYNKLTDKLFISTYMDNTSSLGRDRDRSERRDFFSCSKEEY